jgi:hypothetical protein
MKKFIIIIASMIIINVPAFAMRSALRTASAVSLNHRFVQGGRPLLRSFSSTNSMLSRFYHISSRLKPVSFNMSVRQFSKVVDSAEAVKRSEEAKRDLDLKEYNREMLFKAYNCQMLLKEQIANEYVCKILSKINLNPKLRGLAESGNWLKLTDSIRVAAISSRCNEHVLWPNPDGRGYELDIVALIEKRVLERLKMEYTNKDSFSAAKKTVEMANNIPLEVKKWSDEYLKFLMHEHVGSMGYRSGEPTVMLHSGINLKKMAQYIENIECSIDEQREGKALALKKFKDYVQLLGQTLE